jgi:two-component system NtrC family sensor kinase
MAEGTTSYPEVLLIGCDEPLALRIESLLGGWRIRCSRSSLDDALSRGTRARAAIVCLTQTEDCRASAEKLRVAGLVPIALGSRTAAIGEDVDCAGRPSELLAAIHRAQGRLSNPAKSVADRISRFSHEIASQFAMPELVRVATAKIRELCEADGASVLLIDSSTGELTFDAVEGGAGGAIEQIRLPRGRGVAGKVAIEAKPRLVADVTATPDFDKTADLKSGFATGSIIAAPLLIGGNMLGVLMGVRSMSSPAFASLHLDRLVNLAPHVAIAVHNVQINSALRVSQAEVMEINSSLERKVNERTEQIIRSKQEWERTFDAIDEPIALMDGFVVRRANLAYAKTIGRSIREVPGTTCHEVFARRETPCPNCPLVLGRGAALKTEIETPDAVAGRVLTFRLSGYWMSEDPASRTMVVTYTDVSQAKSLQEKLRESERLAAIGQLASGAAHEINNPLGFVASNLRNLRGAIDELRAPVRALSDALMMAKEKRLEDLVEFLSGIEEPDHQTLDDGLEMIDESLDGARRVGDIVKGLRELSRLEIGKREPADVNASVSRVVRTEFGEPPPHLSLELKAGAMADIPPLQLDQALTHILKNAKQATPAKQRIVIETFNTGASVSVRVRDEGAGISKENVRRVFEPFFTTRGVGKGVGLGLTAAYGIVKRVGGDIEVESEGPGKGAAFTVLLPVAESVPLEKVA